MDDVSLLNEDETNKDGEEVVGDLVKEFVTLRNLKKIYIPIILTFMKGYSLRISSFRKTNNETFTRVHSRNIIYSSW